MEMVNLKIVIMLTIGFTLACLLGYLTQRIKLSPILGYLVAGYLIGPYSPGIEVDLHLAEQLAEVGVMLMMFGVGLHFKWQDLVNVKNIAIPGAIGQTFVATLAAAILVHYLLGSWQAGVLIGLAIGVASTVVLVRVLADHHLLNTAQGHIAVGWLIVEDILTVIVLILLPTIVAFLSGSSISPQEILSAFGIVLIKFSLLAAIIFTLGRKFVSYALFQVARTRSPELFTLGVLALTFLIATGSALLFGTSIALGAFLAGMVIGQTDVRHQASAYASPMKDTFVVIFFLAVGMLFNPQAIGENFSLFLGVLAIILIIKPLTAYIIVILMRYPKIVAISIAFALAQIGEFSFILAEEAGRFNIFPDEAYDIIVACALVSISLNPLMFKLLDWMAPHITEKETVLVNSHILAPTRIPRALVVGYGTCGRNIIIALEQMGYHPVIIEKEVDKISQIKEEGRVAVFGDASFPNMLEMAHVELSDMLMISIKDLSTNLQIIQYARKSQPDIRIIALAENYEEQNILSQIGVESVCYEEEINQAFVRLLNSTS